MNEMYPLVAPPKSYDSCINCRYRKVACAGPRTTSMAITRWAEWIKALSAKDGISRSQLCEAAGISESSLNRMLSKTFDGDINRTTANRIESIFFGSGSQYPCALAAAEHSSTIALELEAKSKDLVDTQHALEVERQTAETDKERIRGIYQARISHLLEEIAHLHEEIAHLHSEVDFLHKVVERNDKIIERQGTVIDKLTV